MGAWVGRDAELARLQAVRADVTREGAGRFVLLSGEPGIGKTRLADELARLAAHDGAHVAWGRCAEIGHAPAYWPWTQVLRTLARGEDGSDLRALLPDLTGPHFTEDSNEARFVLFDGVARALGGAAARQPLVVILDDVHQADPSSLRLLRFVARALRTLPVFVLATQRDAGVAPRPELASLLGDVAREAEPMSLARLSAEDVHAWIARESPSASAWHETVHRVSEGIPLFVEEILRVSRARGSGDALLPSAVRTTLRAHVALCEPAARRVVALGACMGRVLDPAIVAHAADADAESVRDALRHAVEVGLASERGDGHFVIRHALLCDALDETLTTTERSAAHWRIGNAWAARGAPGRAVHHAVLGVSAGDAERVVSLARDAARDALTRDGYEDAGTALRAAASVLPAGDLRATALSIEAAEASMRAGDVTSARAELVALAAHAEARSASELVARAALAYGQELRGTRPDPTLTRLARSALAGLPADATLLCARVTARLAAALVPGSHEDHEEARRRIAEAQALEQALDDPDTTHAVLSWVVPAMTLTASTEERAPLTRRWVATATACGDAIGELRARQLDLLHRIEGGDLESGLAGIEHVVRRIGRPYHGWRLLLARAISALAGGRSDASRTAAMAMREMGDAAGAPFVATLYGMLRLSALYADGDVDAWRADEANVADVLQGPPPAEYFRACASALTGDLDEARAFLGRRAPAEHLPRSVLVPAAIAAWRTGETTVAAELYTLLAPDEPGSPFTWGPSGAFCAGPLALVLARLSTTLGRRSEADRWYERALSRTARCFPLHHASAQRERAALGSTPAPPPPHPAPLTLTRDGDRFRLEGRGHSLALDDRKGVHYLSRLLAEPGRELHVLELWATGVEQQDLGPLLDAKAKAAYRKRLAELDESLEEATRTADRVRAERARAEIESLGEQLGRAVGLGGRDRKQGASAEKARINVQRRLRDVLQRVRSRSPELGRWLDASIRTGTYCKYEPLP